MANEQNAEQPRKEQDSTSLISTILDGMPPIAKAFFLTLMGFPLILAMSGMLLNLNIGSIIQQRLEDRDRAIVERLTRTKDEIAEMVKLRVDDQIQLLDDSLQAFRIEQAQVTENLRTSLESTTADLNEDATAINGILLRVEEVETRLSEFATQHQVDDLNARMEAITSLQEQVDVLGEMRQELVTLRRRLTAAHDWICDNDGLPPGQCTINQYLPSP